MTQEVQDQSGVQQDFLLNSHSSELNTSSASIQPQYWPVGTGGGIGSANNHPSSQQLFTQRITCDNGEVLEEVLQSQFQGRQGDVLAIRFKISQPISDEDHSSGGQGYQQSQSGQCDPNGVQSDGADDHVYQLCLGALPLETEVTELCANIPLRCVNSKGGNTQKQQQLQQSAAADKENYNSNNAENSQYRVQSIIILKSVVPSLEQTQWFDVNVPIQILKLKGEQIVTTAHIGAFSFMNHNRNDDGNVRCNFNDPTLQGGYYSYGGGGASTTTSAAGPPSQSSSQLKVSHNDPSLAPNPLLNPDCLSQFIQYRHSPQTSALERAGGDVNSGGNAGAVAGTSDNNDSNAAVNDLPSAVVRDLDSPSMSQLQTHLTPSLHLHYSRPPSQQSYYNISHQSHQLEHQQQQVQQQQQQQVQQQQRQQPAQRQTRQQNKKPRKSSVGSVSVAARRNRDESTATHGHDGYNMPVRYLKQFEEVLEEWTPLEMAHGRRIVAFTIEHDKKKQDLIHVNLDKPATLDDETLVDMQIVQLEHIFSGKVSRESGDVLVNCISAPLTDGSLGYFITSVDLVYLLEKIVGIKLLAETKNRIRRTLERFQPLTIPKPGVQKNVHKNNSSNNQAYSGASIQNQVDFFMRLMSFDEPKPRNIEKDIKIYPWVNIPSALLRVLEKHGDEIVELSASQKSQMENGALQAHSASGAVYRNKVVVGNKRKSIAASAARPIDDVVDDYENVNAGHGSQQFRKKSKSDVHMMQHQQQFAYQSYGQQHAMLQQIQSQQQQSQQQQQSVPSQQQQMPQAQLQVHSFPLEDEKRHDAENDDDQYQSNNVPQVPQQQEELRQTSAGAGHQYADFAKSLLSLSQPNHPQLAYDQQYDFNTGVAVGSGGFVKQIVVPNLYATSGSVSRATSSANSSNSNSDDSHGVMDDVLEDM
ncbi:hypothetical protein MIR68_000149 [Amoeboaphelidium protococcarum]|nr:hypothetical protein MIR68_000149 [Amoeboaphelidium protococcarum]